MKTSPSLTDELQLLLERYGRTEIEERLRTIAVDVENPAACTILINKGLHAFPEHLFRGETFVFYEGSADLSSAEAFQAFTVERLKRLAQFLGQKKWASIDIVISGQAALCMQVKLAVYRVTHIETTDWVFDGEGRYLPLKISLRSILASSKSEG